MIDCLILFDHPSYQVVQLCIETLAVLKTRATASNSEAPHLRWTFDGSSRRHSGLGSEGVSLIDV